MAAHAHAAAAEKMRLYPNLVIGLRMHGCGGRGRVAERAAREGRGASPEWPGAAFRRVQMHDCPEISTLSDFTPEALRHAPVRSVKFG